MSLTKKYVQSLLLPSAVLSFVLGSFFMGFSPAIAYTIPNSCPQSLLPGGEVKVPGKPAIYVLDSNLKPRYFFSGYVYKSFKTSYGGYTPITQECLGALGSPAQAPFGITYHPGSYLLKRGTDPQLYAVLPGNALAKVSVQIAQTLYGSNYPTRVLDDREWVDYTCKKPDLTQAKVHPGMTFKVQSDQSKVWYLDTQSKLHEVALNGLSSNYIVSDFIYTVPDSATQGFSKGDTINAGIPELMDRTGSNVNCEGVVVPPPNTDNQAPTVFITSPVSGVTVKDTATIQATASDNVGVTKVDFYLNNNLVGSDASSPYSFDWNTKNTPNGNVTLQARAYDAAGNVGMSPSVSVKVENSVQSNEVGELKITQIKDLFGTPSKDQVAVVDDFAMVYAFKLEAQKEPIKLTSLKLTARGGKLKIDDISSVKLFRQLGDNGPIEDATPLSDNKLQKNCDAKSRFGDGIDAECVFSWTDANNLLPDAINPGIPVYIRVRVDIGKKGSAHLGSYFKFLIASNADVVGKGTSSGKEVSILPTLDLGQTGYTQIVPARVEIVGFDPEQGKVKTISTTSWIGIFKVFNRSNKAVQISRLKFVDKGIHEGNATTYQIFYRPDGVAANILAATTNNDSFDFRNLNGGSGILVDANSFTYIAIAFDKTGAAKPGDVWSLTVPEKPTLPSDPTAEYFMRESVYGYDNDYDGQVTGFIDHMPIIETPSLGVSALEGAPPRGF